MKTKFPEGQSPKSLDITVKARSFIPGFHKITWLVTLWNGTIIDLEDNSSLKTNCKKSGKSIKLSLGLGKALASYKAIKSDPYGNEEEIGKYTDKTVICKSFEKVCHKESY